jgi:hypothetical protein
LDHEERQFPATTILDQKRGALLYRSSLFQSATDLKMTMSGRQAHRHLGKEIVIDNRKREVQPEETKKLMGALRVDM